MIPTTSRPGPLCEVNFDACARDAICSLNATCEDVPLDVHLLHPDGPSETCEGCDDGYEIFIDGASQKKGSLLEVTDDANDDTERARVHTNRNEKN